MFAAAFFWHYALPLTTSTVRCVLFHFGKNVPTVYSSFGIGRTDTFELPRHRGPR